MVANFFVVSIPRDCMLTIYIIIVGGLALCLAGTVDEKFQLVFDLVNIAFKLILRLYTIIS